MERRAMTTLLSEGVAIEVTRAQKGVRIDVTSDDPEQVEAIKEHVSAYFESLNENIVLQLRYGLQATGETAEPREAGPPESAAAMGAVR